MAGVMATGIWTNAAAAMQDSSVGTPSMSDHRGLMVAGCSEPTTGKAINGTYNAVGTNHERPTFRRRSDTTSSVDVFIYYWDERDGERFQGWWIGPQVGGDQVWAYQGEAAPEPPARGWQVPFGGHVDPGLRVLNLGRKPQTQSLSLQANGKGKGTGRPAALGSQGQVHSQAAGLPQIAALGGCSGRPPQALSANGHAAANRVPAGTAVQSPVQPVRPPVVVRQQAQTVRPPELGMAAPCIVDVGASGAGLQRVGGAGIKRLASLTGCSIDMVRTAGGAPTSRFRLSGGPKQRRLATDALRGAAEGLEPEDAVASASGALVLPHEISHEGRREWLAWRLVPLQHSSGAASLQMTARAVRATFKEDAANAQPNREQLRGELEAAMEEAQELVELTVEVPAGLQPEVEDAKAAVAPLLAQHGLLLRVRSAAGADAEAETTVHVLGPQAAAQDAAAVLWERFTQGHATAAVLQAPGQVQALSGQMAGDFEKDLQGLEAECGVRVHKAETLLWLDGPDAKAVSSARGMLREVLQFYLPAEFMWVQGLSRPLLEQLKEDAELRAIAASPSCAVALETEGSTGSAWLCGLRCSDAHKRILARQSELKDCM